MKILGSAKCKTAVSIIGITLLFGIFMTPVTQAVSEEVEIIQEAIRHAGAEWVAADNWITALSPEERLILSGGLEPYTEDQTERDVIIWPDTPDPRAGRSSMDWRNYSGYNWMTSIKNQLNCGSCAAFASCGAVEAGYRIASSNPGMAIDLSEQHLFSCGGGDCVYGWYLNEAMDYFVNPGVPDEACLPYSQSDSNCGSTCSDWQSRVYQIPGWSYVTQGTTNETAIKNAIAIRPIPCRMEIYDDFYSYSSGVYTYTYGSNRGGHFVVMVGWNDAENSWICKNSWGSGWGESGYFRIRRDQVVIGTWAMLPSFGGSPTPTPTTPPTQAYLYFRMPATYYTPGDLYYLDAVIENSGSPKYYSALFVALNIYNDFWFWPSWVKYPAGIDWAWINMETGAWYWEVLPAFYWPTVYAGMNGINYIGVAMDTSVTQLLTNVAFYSWGFGY
ncbi:hypothetical protein JW823_03235 [bacterium]|nr:hypothetical protein [candidate division CSSED10-310 bacterium]